MMGYDGGWTLMAAFGWLGMPAMLLFWLGLLALVVWPVGAASQRREASADSALEILRRRYARGEIDREAFDEARKALG